MPFLRAFFTSSRWGRFHGIIQEPSGSIDSLSKKEHSSIARRAAARIFLLGAEATAVVMLLDLFHAWKLPMRLTAAAGTSTGAAFLFNKGTKILDALCSVKPRRGKRRSRSNGDKKYSTRDDSSSDLQAGGQSEQDAPIENYLGECFLDGPPPADEAGGTPSPFGGCVLS